MRILWQPLQSEYSFVDPWGWYIPKEIKSVLRPPQEKTENGCMKKGTGGVRVRLHEDLRTYL
jgi:hypothetical protein